MALTVFSTRAFCSQGWWTLVPKAGPVQQPMHGVAEQTIGPAGTAWHCCLECFSVATRLPVEYRLSPDTASQLLHQEVFALLH